MQEINGVKVPFVPIGGVDGIKSSPQIETPNGKTFEEVLRGELEGIRFSHHAQTRLESRNVSLSDEDLRQLSDAVDLAGQKGSHDSLVIMKNVAFIVNVKNRTVVTAVVGDAAGGNTEAPGSNVFTNIDSAVLVNK